MYKFILNYFWYNALYFTDVHYLGHSVQFIGHNYFLT